jgi:hypothetical protein
MTDDAERSWYILKNDQQVGPIADATFRQFIAEGLVGETDLIWRQGLPAWIAAKQLPEFSEDKSSKLNPPPLPKHAFSPQGVAQRLLPPPLPKSFAPSNPKEGKPSVGDERRFGAPAPAEVAAQESESSSREPSDDHGANPVAKPRKAGYLAQHWRGQFSLPISYWFNGFLGYFFATIAVTAIGTSSLLRTDFSPGLSLLSMIGAWATAFVVLCWQVVGTWRAATRFANNTRKVLWSATAKISLCIAVIATLVQFANRGAPQIREMYGIHQGDAEVGKYAFRVLRDGAELEFSGGITFGAAKEFTQFVDAMGALKIVHLNSRGGRIEEAQRIGDLIKKRGLNTYVPNSCLSACTIMFLSGKNRFITTSAKIGFHQPNFAGLTEADRIRLARREESRLQGLGLSASFARRANEVAPQDMWMPPAKELIEERVATRIVDGSKFAVSGYTTEDITPENADRLLRNIPMYASIESMNTRAYQKILDEFVDGFRRGKSTDEMMIQIAPILDQLFEEALPNVPPAILVEYVEMTVRHLRLLNRESPAACYSYANPEKDRSGLLATIRSKFPALMRDQTAIKTKVFSGYRSKVPVGVEGELISRSIADVVKSLEGQYGQDAKLIGKAEISQEEYSSYCRVIVAFYEGVLRLPSNIRIATLRKMFGEK